jgi:uncharacterized membrane protein
MPAGAAAPAHAGVPPESLAPRPAALVQGLSIALVTGVLGLIALGLAWELWLAPTGSGTLALKVLPLAFALPGLVRHRLYTARWLSLLVWLYITEGLVRATSDQGLAAMLALAEIGLGAFVFIGCAAYVRRRLADGVRLGTQAPAS